MYDVAADSEVSPRVSSRNERQLRIAGRRSRATQMLTRGLRGAMADAISAATARAKSATRIICRVDWVMEAHQTRKADIGIVCPDCVYVGRKAKVAPIGIPSKRLFEF
jgi:hypothetical protein